MDSHASAATPPVLHSISEARRQLNLGRSTIYELLARRQLSAVKIGARTLITDESLAAFVKGLPSARFTPQGTAQAFRGGR